MNELCIDRLQMITPGDTKADVERLLGEADNPTGAEWFYYLDEHVGYVISFDRKNQVEAINSWKS